jgi:signal transduction histidine kinase
VHELIERVLRRMLPSLTNHPVLRQIPAGLPQVRLDAVQIEQVLTNLIENAAKYSPPGTPITILAGVESDQASGLMLRIAVADQGAGIPANEQQRIFETFYRVAGGVRGVSGTGMGLAIVKGLVEAHGGQVRVDSAPGAGSTFSVLLPLEQQTVQAGTTRRLDATAGLPR